MTRSVDPGRRRTLTILAGMGAALLTGRPAAAAPAPLEWRGTAMGAAARLVLHDADPARARAAVAAVVAEIERLEDQFSLYRDASALSALNRTKRLDAPSIDMRRLLAVADRVHRLTGGAFDPTVQPLWELMARHHADPLADPAGPPAAAVDAALARTGWARARWSAEAIELAPGMALTFNGIAQGYVTDRAAELLRRLGWRSVFVDLGEARALAPPPGRPDWRIGLDGTDHVIGLTDAALATSSNLRTSFDGAGRVGHLFDPRTGRPADPGFTAVSVAAADAATADALSTALFAMPREAWPPVLGALDARAFVTERDGGVTTVET